MECNKNEYNHKARPKKKNNRPKNKLLITQRNQGIEGSRGQICLFSSYCMPMWQPPHKPCGSVALSCCLRWGSTFVENLQDHMQELLCLEPTEPPFVSLIQWAPDRLTVLSTPGGGTPLCGAYIFRWTWVVVV